MPYRHNEDRQAQRRRDYLKKGEVYRARAQAHYLANIAQCRARFRARVISPEERARRAEQEKKKRSEDKMPGRIYRLRYKYGLTMDQFNAMLADQDFRCLICGIHHDDAPREGLHVDHDHKTKEVRGLLCTNCNKGLGCLADNIDIIAAAFCYLEDRQCRSKS